MNSLSQISNKTSLFTFPVIEWNKVKCTEMLQKVLFGTVDDKCYKITPEGSEEALVFWCMQEEADGRLLLLAAHAAGEGYQAAAGSLVDTYVFIMCLAFHENNGAPLFQKCRTKTRTRVLYTGKIRATVGRDVFRTLIGMHAYTGCDTVSTFTGKWKASAPKVLTNNKERQDTFMELVQEWDHFPDLMDKLEAFTCLPYAPKTSAV